MESVALACKVPMGGRNERDASSLADTPQYSYGCAARASRWLLRIAAIAALCTVVAAGSIGQPALTPSEATNRARLLELQREASDLLNAASRTDRTGLDIEQALAAASHRLEALGAEPEPNAAGTSGPGSPLSPALRADLRRAAHELAAAIRSASPGRVEIAPLLALLERARTALEGEIALGLSLQGSYSRPRIKEPVYGGHATGMATAPPVAPSADPASSPVTFEEPARLTARTFAGGATKDHILESVGTGIVLFDYDGDGRLDIYLVTAPELTPARMRIPHRNTLYRNVGGWAFEDVSQQANVDAAAWGNGACAGDADGDGQLDLYVTNWGWNFLFRNRGDGTFENIAAAAGLSAGGWSTGCAFLDADADGDLDLYVARYVETTWDDLFHARRTLVWRGGPRIMTGPMGLPGEADLFFENLGNGRFVEAAAAHGLADNARAYGLAVVATDYDDDGFVDLFVANDSNPNFLYRNRGDGRYESVGLLAGVGVNADARAQAGMGADAGDYDGDGRLDIVLTAFAHDRNTVYRNVDGQRFEDATVDTGLAAATFVRMGWGTAFLDADLDGLLDLFVVNGHIFAEIDDYPTLGESYRQTNQFLLNRGGRFTDVSDRAGAALQVARVGRGLAVGDIDNDGDPDVIVSNMDDYPALLENRQQTGHHWIGFTLRSQGPNRFAIGARVTITGGHRTQVREVRSGGSYLSQSDLRPLFGLGEYSGPITVDVRMPGGSRWRWQGLAPDRFHVLELSGTGDVPQAAVPR